MNAVRHNDNVIRALPRKNTHNRVKLVERNLLGNFYFAFKHTSPRNSSTMSSKPKSSSKSKQPAVTVSAKDGSSSPLAILAIAVAGGIGYFAWKRWKQWKAEEEAERKEVRDGSCGTGAVTVAVTQQTIQGVLGPQA